MKFGIFLLSWITAAKFAESATFDVTPKDSIQTAIDKAQPGDTDLLGDEIYEQDFATVRDGTKDKIITVTGFKKAIVNGAGESRMIEVNNDYITVNGVTVDGMKNGGKKFEDYVDKCVFVIGAKSPVVIEGHGVEYESSLDSFLLENMYIHDCGAECVRLRSFITNAEIVGNHIQGCGRHDFIFPSSVVNGEGIYIGTSSNQWEDGKNSRGRPDLTKYIWVHENEIITEGNEAVDVKEETTDVLVEYNVCSAQCGPNSAGLDSCTDDVIFRYNEVFDTDGAGVRIGGHTIDGHTYGQNNEVYGNEVSKKCENECDTCVSRGSLGRSYTDIEGACPGMRDPHWITPGKAVESVASSPATQEEPEDEVELEMKSKETKKEAKDSNDSIDSDDLDDSDFFDDSHDKILLKN